MCEREREKGGGREGGGRWMDEAANGVMSACLWNIKVLLEVFAR